MLRGDSGSAESAHRSRRPSPSPPGAGLILALTPPPTTERTAVHWPTWLATPIGAGWKRRRASPSNEDPRSE